MSDTKYGVSALGNALVDVLSQTSDEFIQKQNERHGMEKGAMMLVDETRATELYNEMPEGVQTSGGSAANTMAGFASFGGKGAFIGKVANDKLGEIFAQDIKSLGVQYNTPALTSGISTGRCMILVTPDAQRTMNTFLGASIELTPADVNKDTISAAKVTYLEGYLFDRQSAKEAFITAAKYAHEAGRKIALTLSDSFCVERHRNDFLNFVENHVDILFANEDEIKSLYMQQDFDKAINELGKHVDIAAVTRGEKGAVITTSAEQTITIEAMPLDKLEDTTGAGDQFAAGFLYGYTQGYSLEKSGKLGALAAAEVISHIGPRPKVSLAILGSEILQSDAA